jgi:Arc/MetJ-type ribon-helix-helix transcriptional regulator
MKQKLSITVEDKTADLLERYIQSGRFRNRSHAIEYSINTCLGDEDG